MNNGIESLYEKYLSSTQVCTDTRKLQPGALFFALSGPNFNGNTFAATALELGASYAVVDEPAYALSDRYLLVANTLTALQQLATYHRNQLGIPVLAITGSNGKTTTKELIHAVLKTKLAATATAGNLNNHIGIPLTLLAIPKGTELAIVEMGANHQKEIEGYCAIAQPIFGLITNCGKAHIEGFGGVEGVRKGKGELYDYLRATKGTLFRNIDLDYLKEMAHDIDRQITYGANTNADYSGQPGMSGVLLGVTLADGTIIHTQLVGDYNFANVMAAVAVGRYFGIPMDNIVQAIGAYSPDNSRSQWLTRGTNHIILDAYNANPTSMRAAIINFAQLDLPAKSLWLGGMKEMGADEAAEHSALVELIANYSWQQVILVGQEFSAFAKDYLWFPDSGSAATYIAAHQPEGSNILIKGSRGSKMEIMLAAVQG